MDKTQLFRETIQKDYTFKGPSLKFGKAKYQDAVFQDCPISIPLKTLNRHGLIAGATGTGKTKTLQVIAEGLSDAGIPSVHLDIKGDLSGLAAAGILNGKIQERYNLLGEEYIPRPYPVEFFSLSEEKGTRLRATVSEFGPILLSKILNLNDTQAGILAVLFKYCDDHQLPLLDLKDLIKVLQYAGNEGKDAISAEYGNMSGASLNTILRKIVGLQQQDADLFFGERSFDPQDLLRKDEQGRGMINILRVTDMQTRPDLFSTFLLQLLAEIYATFPEEGDLEKPKLMLFIDEAHLIFKEGSKALLSQLESIIKLIRSKGVGIFFCTQNPMDIPASVLGQLGLKVQHALRAFTAVDRTTIKKTAENYPLSDFYQANELLTQLGIGEAMVTLLNEKGIPTALVHAFLLTPHSRMDILTNEEIDSIIRQSPLIHKYNEVIDRESAYEILNKKLDNYTTSNTATNNTSSSPAPSTRKTSTTTSSRPKSTKKEKPILEKVINSAAGKQMQRSIVRTLFGVITKMLK